jgi:hypothetical protein
MILCACCLGYKLALITHTSPFSFPLKWKAVKDCVVLSSLHAIMEMLIYDEITFIFLKTIYDLNIEHRWGSGCFYYLIWQQLQQILFSYKKALVGWRPLCSFKNYFSYFILFYFIFQTITIIPLYKLSLFNLEYHFEISKITLTRKKCVLG